MSNVIVIDASTPETRVAALEGGMIREFHMERRRTRGVVGNVYLGRVVRVLPGMQAAFVDIGLEKAGFLYVGDVYSDHEAVDFDEEDDDDDGDKKKGGRRKRREAPPIQDQLKSGQQILVQVVKDPIGTKGARITGHVSLPGRNLVFMPTVEHLGISRQIASDKERKRLRALSNEMRPSGGGFIVRTAAEGVPSDLLRQDMEVLINLWNEIMRQADKAKAPKLLHEDLDLILRATRDLATDDLDALVVDTRETYDRIMSFIERVMPRFADRVELYVGSDPIFDAYGLEAELQTALSRRADLPSGGYLIIEKTEALTSIDVNTGRFVGKRNLEETIVQTNIEAANEVAYQLRLRSIGGLVMVDFIDMDDSKNRRRVEDTLNKALAGDKGRVKTSRISEFGILEMTRKRTGESLVQLVSDICDHCDGTGYVYSAETSAYTILRELRRQMATIPQYDVHVLAHPKVISLLEGRERDSIRDLNLRFNKRIKLVGDPSLHIENFDVAGAEKPKPRG